MKFAGGTVSEKKGLWAEINHRNPRNPHAAQLWRGSRFFRQGLVAARFTVSAPPRMRRIRHFCPCCQRYPLPPPIDIAGLLAVTPAYPPVHPHWLLLWRSGWGHSVGMSEPLFEVPRGSQPGRSGQESKQVADHEWDRVPTRC